MEGFTLVQAVAWLLTGGGAGIVAFWLMNKVGFLKDLAPDYKRYASIILVMVIAGLVWGFGMIIGYIQVPGVWQVWLEDAFAMMFIALSTSQAFHGATSLRQKRLNS